MSMGALSLVMFVWLGISSKSSRTSTLTGRSTTGMRNRRPGSLTSSGRVLPEAEDDEALVLIDDAHGQVEHDGHDDEEQEQWNDDADERPIHRSDRPFGARLVTGAQPRGRPRPPGPHGVNIGQALHDERQSIMAHDAHRRAARQRAAVLRCAPSIPRPRA